MSRTKLDLYGAAAKLGWTYNGDASLRQGGYFWRDADADDYVEIVEVNACSDAGGPDNLWQVERGSVYLSDDNDKRWQGLDIVGADRAFIGPYELGELVFGMKAYWGMEADPYGVRVVRIGAKDDSDRNGWNPDPDKILPANAHLRNYVFKEFLA